MYILCTNVIYQFVCHCNSRYVGCASKGCKNALSNKFSGRSKTIILLKTALIFPMPARQSTPLKLLPMTLLLESIFWKTLPVPSNTVTPNFLSLVENVPLFNFQLLKLLLSNLFNLIYANTRNFQSKTHSLMLFFTSDWLLFLTNRMRSCSLLNWSLS